MTAIDLVVGVSIVTLTLVLVRKVLHRESSTSSNDVYNHGNWNYFAIKDILKDKQMPAVLVDLDILEKNVHRFAKLAEKNSKFLRIASKSLRVPELIKFVMEKGGPVFKGIMCYSVHECEVLHRICNVNDFVVAYPTVLESDFMALWKYTVDLRLNITLMIDCIAHVESLDKFWERMMLESNFKSAPNVKVCIDVDLAFKLFGGFVRLGVHRSPVDSLAQFKSIVLRIQQSNHVTLAGVMGYEAHVAGVPDANPYSGIILNNRVKRFARWLFANDVAKQRKAIADWLTQQNITLEFFNGGGSGSMQSTSAESCITEVTAGSGFLQSMLFDYYQDNVNECAFVFALPISRLPDKQTVCCQGGGFIASGEINLDKQPTVFLPKGLQTFSSEGFGEVQTPLLVPPNVQLQLGDSVLFRPAKAGEIAERFESYYLLKNGHLIGTACTYRGLNLCFH